MSDATDLALSPAGDGTARAVAGPALRVLMIMADGRTGGGTSHVLDLVDGMDRRFEVGVLTSRGSALASEARRRQVPVWESPFFEGAHEARALLAIRAACREFRPEIIHAHGARAAAWVTLAVPGTPMVRTVHGLHVQHLHGLRAVVSGGLERLADVGADATVFLTERDRAEARRRGLHRPGRADAVIANGVAAPQVARRGPADTDLAFVGRLVEAKDPLMFVDIVATLPGVTACMIGDGPLQGAVMDRIAALRVADRVELVGSLPRCAVQERVARCRLAVLTSRTEGQPLVALEAMSLGIPVVAPDVGGVSETVAEAGVVVPTRTAAAMSEAVRRLLADDEERERLGRAARERFQREFRLDTFQGRTYALYSEVLDSVGDALSRAIHSA